MNRDVGVGEREVGVNRDVGFGEREVGVNREGKGACGSTGVGSRVSNS